MKKWWVRDLAALGIAVVVLIALSYGLERIPLAGMAYYFRIIMLAGINVILAVSLNIIFGHAGQFSMGHAGFMAVGAYLSAFLTFFYANPWLSGVEEGPGRWMLQNLLFLAALLAGGLGAAAAGYLVGLPSLRLRGDYLAVMTLGFGEIIRVVFLNIDKVGGARGLSGVPAWSNFFWVFFFAWVTILVSRRLVASSIGRAYFAVREDEIAAEAMGVNTTHFKVQAFVISSFFAGVAGGLMAHYLSYLNPSMFMFTKSFEVIVMVVLGGLGSISGSVLAAVFLTFLLEQLRYVKAWLNLTSEPRMVIYALLLIILMLTRRQGLLGRREIWDFLPRRKDKIPTDSSEEGDGKMDKTSGPEIR
ncbi:MAG TPA: branched-chain amino acid ABC transporter permease [Thermoanaerobaculia bacterium]|nr:branched-chain amino acid ABC transporter permease [Thermoanaerobaculia bacterium]